MVDHDPSEIPLPSPAGAGVRCPWCSALVASPADVTCRSCGATLQGDAAVDIPGVTAIDVLHVLRTGPPRKVRASLGSLFVGGSGDIQQPSEAELPALALPDAEVRREMLRLRLDAELADLTARADALAAERGIQIGVSPDVAPEPDLPASAGAGPNLPDAAPELDLPAAAGAGPQLDAPPAAGSPGPAAAGPAAARVAIPPEDHARP